MDEDNYWKFIESDCRYPVFSDDDTSFDVSDYHYPVCEE